MNQEDSVPEYICKDLKLRALDELENIIELERKDIAEGVCNEHMFMSNILRELRAYTKASTRHRDFIDLSP